ncbi:MAG: ATP-grasp domain-containing protein [Thermovirgaceae bacterium]
MKVVMMSPHFPPNYDLFSVHLNDLGATVLGIGDMARGALPERLGRALTDYYRVEDMHRGDQLEEALRYFTGRYGRIDRIESHNDHWLDSDAGMRAALDIPGPRPSDLRCMRRKSLMKPLFAEAKIRTPRWHLVTSPGDAERWVKETGFPVVAKPDGGVGAADTFRISRDEELARFLSEKADAEFIMEEFIDGRIFTFDGLTDGQGRIVFCSSLQYGSGMMELENEQLDVFFYTLREIPADLEAAGRRVVQAFDIRERFFHIEFFRTTAEEELVALEINARPPGGPILDMYNHASGIDLYLWWAQAVTGKGRLPKTLSKPYHCAYLGRRWGRRYVHTHGEVLNALAAMIIHHAPVPKVFSTAMGDCYYLLRSQRLEDIHLASMYLFASA